MTNWRDGDSDPGGSRPAIRDTPEESDTNSRTAERLVSVMDWQRHNEQDQDLQHWGTPIKPGTDVLSSPSKIRFASLHLCTPDYLHKGMFLPCSLSFRACMALTVLWTALRNLGQMRSRCIAGHSKEAATDQQSIPTTCLPLKQ